MSKWLRFSLVFTLVLIVALAVSTAVLAEEDDVVVVEDGQSIQEVIDEAEEGARVQLQEGIYSEDVEVHVADLTLFAESDDEAVVEGSIVVTADGVTLDGFSVTGKESEEPAVEVYDVDDVRLENLQITGFEEGISAEETPGLQLLSNTIEGISGHAVMVNVAEDVEVVDNSVEGSVDGFLLNEIQDLLFSGNDCMNNDVGIVFDGCSEVQLHENVIEGNEIGLHVLDSNSVHVEDNEFTDNENGLIVDEDITVVDNVFEGNRYPFEGWDYDLESVLQSNSFNTGQVLVGSEDNFLPNVYSTIQDGVDEADAAEMETVLVFAGEYDEAVVIETDMLVVTAVTNSDDVDVTVNPDGSDTTTFSILADLVEVSGFEIIGGGTGVVIEGDYNLLFDNHIEGVAQDGIAIDAGEGNQIENNFVQENGRWGIRIGAEASLAQLEGNVIVDNGGEDIDGGVIVEEGSSGNILRFNTIADDSGHQIISDENTDTSFNWWGSEDGPEDLENAVEGDVEFEPWLAEIDYIGEALFEDDDEVMLEAQLLDSDENGVEQASVQFLIDGSLVGSAETDGDGRASLLLDDYPAGEREVTVRTAGNMQSTTGVEFDYDTYSLTIQIWDEVEEGQEPLEGAVITVQAVEDEIFSADLQAETDEDGLVAFEDVREGTYDITVEADGYLDVEETDVVIDEDIDIEFELDLHYRQELDEDITITVRPPTINVRSRGVFMVMVQAEDHRFSGTDYSMTVQGIESQRVQPAAFRLLARFDRAQLIEVLDGESGAHALDVILEADGEVFHGEVQVQLKSPGGPPGRDEDDRDGDMQPGSSDWVPPGQRDEHPGRGRPNS